MNSQKGYLLNAAGKERARLNTGFIQEIFPTYLCYAGLDNRDTKAKRYLIVWKGNKARRPSAVMRCVELKLGPVLSTGKESVFWGRHPEGLRK